MTVLNALAIYVCVLVYLLLFYFFYENFKNYYAKTNIIYLTKQKVIKKYSHEDMFKNKIQRYTKMGVLDKYPKLANPIYYFFVHFGLALAFGIAFSVIFNYYMMFVGFVVGYIFLDVIFEIENKSQNEEISKNIMRMYESMYVQLSGGQYIANSVIATRRVVTNERLLKAINEFEKDIKVDNKSTVQAIANFENKFDNTDVLTFCVMVRQNEESGKVMDLLKDLLEQIKDKQNLAFDKKKEQMDIKLTLVMLLIFGVTMAYVLYLFVQGIMANNTFL